MVRPTVRDVARLSGLSVASVSRALSGARQVTPDVRARVETAVRELGYVPDRAARALRSGKTGLVGVVMPDLAGPFFPSLIDALASRLNDAGLAGIVMGTQESVRTEREHVRTLLDRRVDGLIISPVSCAGSADMIRHAAADVDLVQVHRWSSTAGRRVLPDVTNGFQQLRDHLSGLGLSRPCLVVPNAASSAAGDRRVAFVRVFPGAPVVHSGGFAIEDGVAVAASIIALLDEVDTVVCASDLLAVGLMRELNQRGVDVPGDVAVAGYDGTLVAALMQPSVTTIDPDPAAMADAAVAQLMGPSFGSEETVLTPVSLRPRSSTIGAHSPRPR
jgi:LacI family transcriptional regulator